MQDAVLARQAQGAAERRQRNGALFAFAIDDERFAALDGEDRQKPSLAERDQQRTQARQVRFELPKGEFNGIGDATRNLGLPFYKFGSVAFSVY